MPTIEEDSEESTGSPLPPAQLEQAPTHADRTHCSLPRSGSTYIYSTSPEPSSTSQLDKNCANTEPVTDGASSSDYQIIGEIHASNITIERTLVAHTAPSNASSETGLHCTHCNHSSSYDQPSSSSKATGEP